MEATDQYQQLDEQEQEMLKQFEADMIELHKCATIKENNSSYTIRCKLGLWDVSGPVEMKTINEAMRSFTKYKNDGEYDELLST